MRYEKKSEQKKMSCKYEINFEKKRDMNLIIIF